ncbi:hypothetical protein JOQ06_029013 [Pogonophryne albipinna]|uniref:Uncharacterized protein n=1 Tax=Pogonophryne albipinna TaxID=1090488 RepID=A0AAD6FN16_9TELE|nr:hypothetical protein JOQ06_029013 [Pogonophryne albipinna]
MGHCVSYTEVRQFLTSVATDQISRTESGVYIPTGLTGVTEHGIVDAAIDNFDQNEDTLDGKQTTHAMASVVYRRGHVSTAYECLARVPERSLSTLNTADLNGEKLHRYIKPPKRPEPPELPKPEILHINTAVSKAAEGRDLGADLLLRILRSEREADFQLHLNSMCEVIPWFRAAGRTNYAKYMPVYVAEMKALEHEQPEAYTFMQEGGFVVRRSEDHSFNCVATDQALEQTINREGKSQGGVVGFTLRKAALTRWLMTRHVTTAYVDAMKELCDTDAKGPKAHKEHGASRMDRDEGDIQKIMEAVEQKQNPFDLDSIPEELINIASGQVASEKELSSFLQVGAEQNAIFIE